MYAQGLRWELRRSLYRKIEDKPAIATQDTVAAAFYQANQGTPLGKLTQVEQELGIHTQMAANTLTAVLNNGSSIRAKLDSLAILERTLPASPTLAQLSSVAIQKQAVAGRISTLIATQHTLLDPINQDINNAASTWVASNNAISITAVQEENRRKVNMIALHRVVKGQANFTGIELGTLRDVAGQCPITGGNAVYEARSILAYNGEIPAYDDKVLCDSAALAQERYLAPPVGDVRETQGYQLVAVPNPANDYLTIAYSAPVESAVMAMQLFNPIGVMVVALPLNGMQGTQELEMSTLPAGLYYLRFIANGRLISVQKIVVVH